MEQLFQNIKKWWTSADRTTKTVSIVGSLLLVGLIFLTLTMNSAPKLQPVASGMTEAERGVVFDELQKKGFKVDLTPQGEVVVPSKDVARARMVLATANKLPKGAQASFGLDKIGPMDTPSVEREKLLKTLQGELAMSIQTIEGVSSATVHIAPGKDSPILDEKVPPTAVVSLIETQPGSINAEAGRAIANLVQSAVTGLDARGVKVISNAGRIIYDGEEHNGESLLANSKLETERQQSKSMTQQLQRELDIAFGQGTTIADVKVAMNMDPTTTEKIESKPTDKPLKRETGTEKLSGTGLPAVGGIAGAEANNPATPAAQSDLTSGNNKYDGKVLSEIYGESRTTTKLVKAPEIAGQTISVLVDRNKVKNVADLTKFVQGKLGDKLGEPGFTATVVPTEFSTADKELAKKASDEASSAQRMQMLMGLLPVIALLVVGFLVAKSLKMIAPTVTKTASADDPQQQPGFTFQIPQGEIIQDYSALAGYQPRFGDPTIVEHRLIDGRTPISALTGETGGTAVADAETATETVEEREQRQTEEVLRALGIDPDDEEVEDIEQMKSKINVPLERIKRLADRKPELMAMLIKSWLLEDHR